MEDVISVDDKTADDVGTVVPQIRLEDDNICSVGVCNSVDGGPIALLKKDNSVNPDSYFLVLEVQLAFIILGLLMWFLCESCSLSRVVLQVSEKRGLAGSSRVQCPYKVCIYYRVSFFLVHAYIC